MLFGFDDCPGTQWARAQLKARGIAFDYVDITASESNWQRYLSTLGRFEDSGDTVPFATVDDKWLLFDGRTSKAKVMHPRYVRVQKLQREAARQLAQRLQEERKRKRGAASKSK